MNKYEKALSDLKNMIEVGGTLEEADEVVEVFEELVDVFSKSCEILAEGY